MNEIKKKHNMFVETKANIINDMELVARTIGTLLQVLVIGKGGG